MVAAHSGGAMIRQCEYPDDLSNSALQNDANDKVPGEGILGLIDFGAACATKAHLGERFAAASFVATHLLHVEGDGS
jgi:hypothetical protein